MEEETASSAEITVEQKGAATHSLFDEVVHYGTLYIYIYEVVTLDSGFFSFFIFSLLLLVASFADVIVVI